MNVRFRALTAERCPAPYGQIRLRMGHAPVLDNAPFSRAIEANDCISCLPTLGGQHHQYCRIGFATGTTRILHAAYWLILSRRQVPRRSEKQRKRKQFKWFKWCCVLPCCRLGSNQRPPPYQGQRNDGKSSFQVTAPHLLHGWRTKRSLRPKPGTAGYSAAGRRGVGVAPTHHEAGLG